MAIFPAQGDVSTKNVWGTLLRNFFTLTYDLATGYFKDPWVDSRSYSTLALADAAAVAAGKSLLVATNITVSTATTISSYVKVEKGGGFTKSGSGTLTFSGGLEAGDYQIFTGWTSGIDISSISKLNSKWFGVVGYSVPSVITSMASGSTVTIVCVGDSITAGTQAGVTKPYPSRLQEILRSYYNNNNITVVNAGVGGDDTERVLARFDADVMSYNPDVILLMIGVNDARTDRSITTQEYYDNLYRIVSKASNKPVIFISPTAVAKPQNNTTTNPHLITMYRDTMQTVAHNIGIKFVNLADRMSNIYESHSVGRNDVNSDGLHYDDYGYALLAEAIFVDGLCNDDLVIKPGQFKNVTGSWISYSGTPTWRVVATEDGIELELDNASAKLFLYMDSFEESALVMHTRLDNSIVNGKVTISNTTLSGTPVAYTTSFTPTGTTFFLHDYPIVTCSLKPGLNEILLDSTGGFFSRFSGFTTIKTPQYFFSTIKDTVVPADYGQLLWGTTKWFAKGVREIDTMPPAVYSATDEAAPMALLIPKPDGQTTAWRFRGFVQRRSSITLGQMTKANQVYSHAFDLVFNNTQVVHRGFNANGTATTIATDNTWSTGATGNQRTIDIVTGPASYSIYIDGTLFRTETVPLSISPVMFRTPDSLGAAGPVLFNPPVLMGTQEVHTGIVIGEKWIDFSNDTLHFVNKDGTEKSVALT